jgi:hypothetical protein
MSKPEDVFDDKTLTHAEREREVYRRIVNELKEFEITNEDIEAMISSLAFYDFDASGKGKNSLLVEKLIRYLLLSHQIRGVKIKCSVNSW